MKNEIIIKIQSYISQILIVVALFSIALNDIFYLEMLLDQDRIEFVDSGDEGEKEEKKEDRSDKDKILEFNFDFAYFSNFNMENNYAYYSIHMEQMKEIVVPPPEV